VSGASCVGNLGNALTGRLGEPGTSVLNGPDQTKRSCLIRAGVTAFWGVTAPGQADKFWTAKRISTLAYLLTRLLLLINYYFHRELNQHPNLQGLT